MNKLVALFSAIALVSSLGALADGNKKPVKPAKPATKVVDVWHCPIQGAEVKDHKDKGTVVGAYRVHFCCAGCPEEFAKLPKDKQLAKAKEAAAKDAPVKKKI